MTTRKPQEPRAALARALNLVDENDPGVLNDIAIDEEAAGPIADAILAALAAEGAASPSSTSATRRRREHAAETR